MTKLLIVLAAGPLAAPSNARAEALGERAAVVAVDRCAEGSAAPHAHPLREALGRLGSLEVLSREDTVRNLGGAPRGSLADAERLLASARFDSLDPSARDRAERTLRSAIEDLRVLPPSEPRWQDLRDAQTLLAYLYSRDGDRSRAEDALSRVLAVDPAFEPSIDLYPPSFRAWVDQVRKKTSKRSTSSLRIQTHPAGRPVMVEGRKMGAAPVTVKLPPGAWRVEADFGTGGSMPRTIQLHDAAEVELWDNFEGAVHAGKGPCLTTDGSRDGRLSSLVRLAAVIGVDQLVAVREEEPNPYERYLVASAIDARSGQELREGKVKLQDGIAAPGSYARLAEFLFTGSARPPVLVGAVGAGAAPGGTVPAPALPSASAAPATASRPLNGMRIGAYATGGAAVLGLGGGLLFLLQANAAEDRLAPYRTGPGESFEQKDLAAIEPLLGIQQANRRNALISGAVGLAAAATSAVLFLLSADPDQSTLTPTGNGVQVRF